eukprot:641369-Prorocentrum_minimum.AAC.4
MALRAMLAGPKVGEQWEKVGNWTQGVRHGEGERWGVESTLAVIGTGGPVRSSDSMWALHKFGSGWTAHVCVDTGG